MSQEAKPAAPILHATEGDLFGRTLRTVALLVGACVLFVGALSAAAVAITSKAMGSSAAVQGEVNSTSSTATKKPQSI